ncbi:MAG: hypothetical protein MAG471_00226 [Acidimicrobiaceae bacterium]|nr:hypothetical protein [Acidimicrobiaceae bacterium]
MSERCRTHVGLLRVDGEVHEFGHVVGHRSEAGDSPGWNRLDPHLEAQVGDDGNEVAVADPFSVAVDRSLHLGGSASHAGDCVGDATARVIVEVDTDGGVRCSDHLGHDSLNVERQAASVGVAQDETVGTGLCSTGEHLHRVGRVRLIAVEEVLGIEEDRETLLLEEPDRIGDHCHALIERCPECLGDVVVPGLADDADNLGSRGNEVRKRRIVVGVAVHAPGRPECHQLRMLQLQVCARPLEELDVFGVGSRPAALDVVDTEQVQLFGDAQLVDDRE